MRRRCGSPAAALVVTAVAMVADRRADHGAAGRNAMYGGALHACSMFVGLGWWLDTTSLLRGASSAVSHDSPALAAAVGAGASNSSSSCRSLTASSSTAGGIAARLAGAGTIGAVLGSPGGQHISTGGVPAAGAGPAAGTPEQGSRAQPAGRFPGHARRRRAAALLRQQVAPRVDVSLYVRTCVRSGKNGDRRDLLASLRFRVTPR